MIQFLLNNTPVTVENSRPTITLLDWLRKDRGLVGTKEGCASGDCGACTLLVGEQVAHGSSEKQWRYKTINSCLMLLGNAHGKHIVTVEAVTQNLYADVDELHPVQKAMVESHGSQCGFCTPGIIMSLLALYINNASYPGKKAVIHALGGNLCRCTGYQPILKAAEKAFEYERQPVAWAATADSFARSLRNAGNSLKEIPSLRFEQNHFYVPQSLKQLVNLKNQCPEARLIAGGTDLSIEFTQQLTEPAIIISVTQVTELIQVSDSGDGLVIGAAATYADFIELFCRHYPESKELFERLGSEQIRNGGTLGGSLGNASPIGDPAPLLIALDATLELVSIAGTRHVKVEDFFTGYRQTVLTANEVIRQVLIPKRPASLKLASHKISKRFEDDISTVCLVLAVDHADDQITAVRCAMGGMAALPARAKTVEQQLLGASLSQHSFNQAASALAQDFSPMSDVRASAEYRLTVSQNLLTRIGYEFCQPIDVVNVAEQPAVRIAHASL
ncbi:xanthine dehydrogenase small subunit [Alteromonas sp. ASW11-36]|uniref:Xanthine dehydrogenase small subunit n=1 Tax=Alteromonas arenosi TaxID=3055817 RepID=A0ABT7SYS2_9ALTE|nr:xanthine dehydrogenase small subunit [Alteromonas sp. ASW11-36]MDM7861340.1 xanthine dehydrogenase small subunit [Alteromonas sp. ASW11-36]